MGFIHNLRFFVGRGETCPFSLRGSKCGRVGDFHWWGLQRISGFCGRVGNKTTENILWPPRTAGVEVGDGNCFSTGDSQGNVIAGNGLPSPNGNYGIVLDCHTGTGTEVLGNVLVPGVGSIDDLFDANYPSCDSNTWTGNTFTKANQTCIH